MSTPSQLDTLRWPDDAAASPVARLIAAAFEIGLSAFAAWTVLCQISLEFGISFRTLSVLFSFTLILLAVAFGPRFISKLRTSLQSLGRDQTLLIFAVMGMSTLGALLGLLPIRPDLDDVNYLSRVVYHLEHPNVPLDLNFHDFWILQTQMSSVLKLFQTWTFLCGYLAYLTNTTALDVYHLALPALGGALIPLSWFLVFSKFTRVSAHRSGCGVGGVRVPGCRW